MMDAQPDALPVEMHVNSLCDELATMWLCILEDV